MGASGDAMSIIELRTSIAASCPSGEKVDAGGPVQVIEYQSLFGFRARFNNAPYCQ